MSQFAAFLRAVNVGGTGKLPMSELRRICAKLGFTDVQTYIASGNVVFESKKSRKSVKTALECALYEYVGKEVGVIIRTAAEVRSILKNNPFPDNDPKRTVAILLDRKPPSDALTQAVGQTDEEIVIGEREIYVYYTSGMARSKLRIPAAIKGTARNMNTIKKVAELASD